MRNKWIKMAGGIILTAAITILPAGLSKIYAARVPDDAFTEAAFESEVPYADGIYYHDRKFEDYILLNGVDVSWWQGGGRDSTTIRVDWEKAHEDGIDFAFVRAASRDTGDGSIFTDTCADAHIKAALANDINIGLYIFSQALNEEEAREEARYVLDLVNQYDWDVSLPIAIDREKGSYGRLTAGKLTKEEETAICIAFAEEIQKAGYKAMAYASLNWVNSYWDTKSMEEAGCGIWLARYNNATTSYNIPGYGVSYPYEDVPFGYEFWQYSSSGTVNGYNGRIDLDFWYKNTGIQTKSLRMTENTENTISLKWKGVDDADGYRLYRYDWEQEKYTLAADLENTSYVDTDLTPGETYSYRVRCYWTIGGTKYYGKYSEALDAVTLPEQVALIETDDRTDHSITFSWDEVYGASGYRIYQFSEEAEKFKKLLDIDGGDITCHQIAGLEGAKEYRFKVRPYLEHDGTLYWGANSDIYGEATKPVRVTGAEASTLSPTKLLLLWDEDTNATGYQIYRRDPGDDSYKKVATIEDSSVTEYTDSNLTNARLYTYKVRAYFRYNNKNYYGKYSNISGAVTKPARALPPAVKAKKGKNVLSWSAMDGVSGYALYRYDEGKRKYVKLAVIEDQDICTYRDKAVKKGTTYSYKLRAYITYNGKTYYGGYSEIVEKKAK